MAPRKTKTPARNAARKAAPARTVPRRKPAERARKPSAKRVPAAEAGAEAEPEVESPEDAESDLLELARSEDGGEEAPAPLPGESRRDVALSRTDPLARYMAEVSRHPVLSREEEHELAVRLQQTGDVGAAYRLVASNLRLVVKIAYEYRRAAFNVLDLIQEGNVGLMHAVKKYDPYKGVKLSSYAAWWIRAYILRFIMDNWRMVKLGTTQAQRKLFFNLRKEQAKLAAEGFDVGPKLLAERLNVTEREVEEMDRRLSGDETSLSTPIGDESGTTIGEQIPERAPAADDELGAAELRAVLHEELAAFGRELADEREKAIFERRLISDEPATLQEIGEAFGFSRERARQIEARMIERLRERLRARMPDFAELTFEKGE